MVQLINDHTIIVNLDDTDLKEVSLGDVLIFDGPNIPNGEYQYTDCEDGQLDFQSTSNDSVVNSLTLLFEDIAKEIREGNIYKRN